MQAFKASVQRKFFIDKKIRAKSYPTAASLSRDYEKECNRKIDPRTIATDIAELRQEYNAPIKYDAKHRGYVYSDEKYVFNALQGETETFPYEHSISDWEKNILNSFISETLPVFKEKKEEDLTSEHVTVLPSITEKNAESNIEKIFLEALHTGTPLYLEMTTKTKETQKFLPLHLICMGEDRLFFGKSLKGWEPAFSLINISLVVKAIADSSQYTIQGNYSDFNSETASEDAYAEARVVDLSEKNKDVRPTFYAQTTGNEDIEIIMSQNGKRHIFVFTYFPSNQGDGSIKEYFPAAEFVLNSSK